MVRVCIYYVLALFQCHEHCQNRNRKGKFSLLKVKLLCGCVFLPFESFLPLHTRFWHKSLYFIFFTSFFSMWHKLETKKVFFFFIFISLSFFHSLSLLCCMPDGLPWVKLPTQNFSTSSSSFFHHPSNTHSHHISFLLLYLHPTPSSFHQIFLIIIFFCSVTEKFFHFYVRMRRRIFRYY